MTFRNHEISDAALTLLGIKRKHIEQLPGKISQALLNGMRTSLLRFTGVKLPGDPAARALDARLSLFRKSDQTVGLMVHPAKHHPLPKQGNELITTPSFSHHTTQKSSTEVKNTSSAQSDVFIGENTYSGNKNSVVSVDRQRSSDVHNTKSISDRKWVTPLQQGEQDSSTPSQANHALIAGKISFGHSRIQDTDILIDIGLLASGLGTIIFLEHLADLVLHSRLLHKMESLRDPAFRDALAAAAQKTGQSGIPRDARALATAIRSELSTAGFSHYTDADKSMSNASGKAAREGIEPFPRQRSPGR
jgi:hypothetical protein